MRILLVDDETLSRNALAAFLHDQMGHEVTPCDDAQEALEKYISKPYPLVLSAIQIPRMSGLDLVKSIRELADGVNTGIILFTPTPNVATAVEALRHGADDYLQKPLDLEELDAAIGRISRTRKASAPAEGSLATPALEIPPNGPSPRLQDSNYIELPGMGRVGIFSDAMKAAVTMTRRLHEDRTIPVLIEGETGTGKEVIAHLIHHGEQECAAPFISINCSAISPNLFESELFGYEGGAFTGARKSGIIGKLELAQGGTLFLDEIGDMPLDLQPKLLRALQEREIYRVGGLKKVPLDVRIIGATNRNLKSLVDEGRFRQDLYFRLHVGWVHVPPLREQKEAIIPLAQMFQNQYAAARKRRFRFISQEARARLIDYAWPGNIRELQNTLDRIVLLHDDIELRKEHLNFLTQDASLNWEADRSEIKPGYIGLPPQGLDLAGLESEIVRKALQLFGGNKTKAAQYLGLTRSALRSRLQKLL